MSVDTEEVKPGLLDLNKEYIHVQEARKLLGISYTRLVELTRAGVIKTYSHPVYPHLKFVYKDEIEPLVALKQSVVPNSGYVRKKAV